MTYEHPEDKQANHDVLHASYSSGVRTRPPEKSCKIAALQPPYPKTVLLLPIFSE
jgi:hypothetical protein